LALFHLNQTDEAMCRQFAELQIDTISHRGFFSSLRNNWQTFEFHYNYRPAVAQYEMDATARNKIYMQSDRCPDREPTPSVWFRIYVPRSRPAVWSSFLHSMLLFTYLIMTLELVPVEDCFAPLSVIARLVREVQEEVGTRKRINGRHIIMTSDEVDPNWWADVEAQGWLKGDLWVYRLHRCGQSIE
jgi:hypothetical protein